MVKLEEPAKERRVGKEVVPEWERELVKSEKVESIKERDAPVPSIRFRKQI